MFFCFERAFLLKQIDFQRRIFVVLTREHLTSFAAASTRYSPRLNPQPPAQSPLKGELGTKRIQ